MKKNIVLTGFMGTGKTTVGKLLAGTLDYQFIDTDVIIEQRHGPIATIFAEQGEAAFRQMERAVAAELAQEQGLVIATGGRLMLDAENARLLGSSGSIFCLTATPAEILERVLNDEKRIERPLLNVPDPAQRILNLLTERQAAYSQFTQIPTSNMPPPQIATNILNYLHAA
ncbi:MAG: shikimate kinase [Chloroflexota bacterium]